MNVLSPVKGLIDDLIVKKVTSQVITVLGLASIPLIGGFLTILAQGLIKVGVLWLLEKTIIGGARLWVVGNIDWHVDDMKKATAELQDLLDNPTKYTDQQMAEVEKDFDEKAVALIHIVNARLVS